ncbi:molybdopterin synthase catalytic subunit MoaE [Kordiimonas laminariae]|uniref:molybdopterin synthase catalytic subunit MoaE n=1 Tax=Kordiimonas laminariae TaxID=2917717 RepID=UPI001FF1F10F|nr:molybdopterin synthase catalytic subunit MoaE [Kordiimonas laminariae]MCK0068654.1 molybdopterin synthase catalytic subunit MoaE [Kordiimonas laminariae]
MQPQISVQLDDFDIGNEINQLKVDKHDIGAVVSFVGTVRDLADGLTSMTLEHYPAMTEAELARIAKEAKERWPLEGCRIIHRFGELFPGDNIVLVITASAHRQAAFDAANFIMDFLKTNAPFWKKETTSRGAKWVDANDADDKALERWQK